MHCAIRLKSEPWLNLNLLFLSAYLACHSLIYWLSFILPTVCVRGRLGWRAFTQELSGQQLSGVSATSPSQPCAEPGTGELPLHPRHWVPGLCQHARGRLIYRGDTCKGNMETIKVSGTVLSQQKSALRRSWEREAEDVFLSRGNSLESQI